MVESLLLATIHVVSTSWSGVYIVEFLALVLASIFPFLHFLFSIFGMVPWLRSWVLRFLPFLRFLSFRFYCIYRGLSRLGSQQHHHNINMGGNILLGVWEDLGQGILIRCNILGGLHINCLDIRLGALGFWVSGTGAVSICSVLLCSGNMPLSCSNYIYRYLE